MKWVIFIPANIQFSQHATHWHITLSLYGQLWCHVSLPVPPFTGLLQYKSTLRGGQTSAILKNCSPPSLPLFLEGACGPLCSPLGRWQLFRYPLGHSCHLNRNFVICHLVGHHSIWITSGRGDRQESPDWPLQLFTTDRLVQFRFSLRASWGWTLDPLVYQTW